jgi:hypothetical protein
MTGDKDNEDRDGKVEAGIFKSKTDLSQFIAIDILDRPPHKEYTKAKKK